MKTSFYQLPFEDLQRLLSQNNLPVFNARLLFNWYYKKNKRGPCTLHGVSPRTQSFLDEHLDFELPALDQVSLSSDKTAKFLLCLRDGAKIESVLIPFQNKYTVCLSSQVGCGMGCAFCFTGKQGFSRHLGAEEIIGQFLQVRQWLRDHRPSDDRILNIVYMGQGEPLHNFEAVRDSARIFISQYGLSLADHKITISTSGYLPGLQRWKQEMPNVNLALSLHTPFTDKRSQLIPINRKFPLKDVLELCDQIPQGKKRFVTFEYLLLKNFNDGIEDAHATGRLLQGRRALINLIPFNPFPGADFVRPSLEVISRFKSVLDEYGVPTMIRTTKGDEILAACGQLNTLKPAFANDSFDQP